MFDFIDISNYSNIFLIVLFVVVLLTYAHLLVLGIDTSKNLSYTRNASVFLLIFTILYIGLRPLSPEFPDMITYLEQFVALQDGLDIEFKDIVFSFFTLILARITNLDFYFLILAIGYVLPVYFFAKKYFGKYYFYFLLAVVASLSFLAYGTNTLRSGLAASFFLFALSRDKKISQYLCFILVIGLHQSFLLTVLAYFVARFHTNISLYLKIWFISIVVSGLLGGIFNDLILNLNFIQDRVVSYLETDGYMAGKYEVGFRWDFLFYSSIPVIWGGWILFKRKLGDNFYKVIYSVYLITNSFWILVIRVPYSDRFAYLSWFLIPVIIMYPLLKFDLVKKKEIWIGNAIFITFVFTYFMNVLR